MGLFFSLSGIAILDIWLDNLFGFGRSGCAIRDCTGLVSLFCLFFSSPSFPPYVRACTAEKVLYCTIVARSSSPLLCTIVPSRYSVVISVGCVCVYHHHHCGWDVKGIYGGSLEFGGGGGG